MTGTARSAAGEFFEIYGLRVVPVPTHRPPARVDLPPRLYFTPADKLAYIVEQVQRSWQVRGWLIGLEEWEGGGARCVACVWRRGVQATPPHQKNYFLSPQNTQTKKPKRRAAPS